MALANVAFLAAINKKKVLVMDWDLEAPGLAYYFRGLLEPSHAKELKDWPGLLDLVVDWCDVVSEESSEERIAAGIDKVSKGEVFSEVVRPLVGEGLFEAELTLDYIGTGARLVGAEKKVSYEDVLTQFSWVDFFAQKSGGFFLNELRRWAKKNYDLILIDSRTGFADVAGICTMQLPDEVALCFILNRQNIDGVARVSAAIREKRNDELVIRAVPMRVTRTDTKEGSDARARAIAELTKVGGFSVSGINDDLKNLIIPTYDDAPFYETLAPFAAMSDIGYDAFTMNYVRLASNLLGEELAVPTFDSEMIGIVKRRLVPRYVTLEYLKGLEAETPESAFSELGALIDSAYDSVLAGESIGSDYVDALVHAVTAIGDALDPFETNDLVGRSLDLLRALSAIDQDEWRPRLISSIQEFLDSAISIFIQDEDQLSLLEELDFLLAESGALVNKIKRLTYKRKVVRLYLSKSDLVLANQVLEEYGLIYKEVIDLNRTLPADLERLLVESRVEAFMLQAELDILKGSKKSGYSNYGRALKILQDSGLDMSYEAIRSLGFEVAYKLSSAPGNFVDKISAAQYALMAVTKFGSFHNLVIRFVGLSSSITNSQSPELCLEFLNKIAQFPDPRALSYFINYYGRSYRSADALLSAVLMLSNIAARVDDYPVVMESFGFFSNVLGGVAKSVSRRRQVLNTKQKADYERKWVDLITLYAGCGVDVNALESAYKYGSALSAREAIKFAGEDNEQ
ncbi:CobQ/CobB/MinD/ParA nucleotide binding domain-containing protein [Pseudomonas sp. GM49]|nr:CobQ/CobB/MinD/ParA nucleotide binding domain-containing protein [Pseudomonas sp. GM49]